ncbi:MAG: prepilin-type N-terminal cleavage/methylation domain-containing protein [Planctomycetaceae bacterium]
MNHPNRFYKRRGLTLVELMVASTLGLLLVIGVLEAFRQITDSVTKGRATVQISGQLRNITNVMRADFQGITVQAVPNTAAGAGMGYFEIVEGIDNDFVITPPNTVPAAVDNLSGDTDDVIMFTSRRLDNPFSGRIEGRLLGSTRAFEIIESPNAEIIYWLEPRNTEFLRDGLDNNGDGTTDEPIEGQLDLLSHNGMPLATLRRRALLIRPDLNGPQGVLMQPNGTPYPASSAAFFLNLNDISIRINPNGTISANSLADLTLRQNRVAHIPAGVINNNVDANFPYPFSHTRVPFQSGVAMGEDVIMDQVIGFDLRVFDPDTLVLTAPTQDVALTPSDPGYESALSSGARPVGKGAYVDLGYAVPYTLVNNGATLSFFSWQPRTKSQLSAVTLPGMVTAKNQQYFQFGNYRTYDTWTIEYERDGLDQNSNNLIDEGLDGIDNPNIGRYGVDDNLEAETEPPYLYPLRGFQVIIRAFQNSQQQMRQFTVSHDFTPE